MRLARCPTKLESVRIGKDRGWFHTNATCVAFVVFFDVPERSDGLSSLQRSLACGLLVGIWRCHKLAFLLRFFRLDDKSVLKNMGPNQDDWFRLFVVPGMDHCGGGTGPNQFNKIAVLERWREQNEPPRSISAARVNESSVIDMTRPLCPYPQRAVYNGSGTSNDAANFTCKVRAIDHGPMGTNLLQREWSAWGQLSIGQKLPFDSKPVVRESAR